jgi:hypothetical protein
VLMGILLFNLCGYQILHAYFEERAGQQLEYRLDINNYNETALFSIRVPAKHLAYYNHSIQFDRFNGQVEVCGVLYRYVKRRLYNDYIEMLCIPNQGVMELLKTKIDIFKLVNDLKSSDQEKTPGSHSYKSFSSDFFTSQEPFQIKNPVYRFRKNNFCYTTITPVHCIFTDERPPDMTA